LDPVGDQMKLACNNGQNIRSEWEHASSSTPWGVRKVTFSGCCDGALTRSWFPYKRRYFVKYAHHKILEQSKYHISFQFFDRNMFDCNVLLCKWDSRPTRKQ
jgi:hypothetical protein